jgi:hypothetical protein
LAKAYRQPSELQRRLSRGKTRKAKDSVEAEIAQILKPRWVSRVVSVALVGKEPGELRLRYRTKPKARAGLEEEIFGKRVLFTDKGTEVASTAQVVADYRSQEAAEADFRQMKDPKVVSPSRRCSIGPTRRSQCTCSTACSTWLSPGSWPEKLSALGST